LSFFLFPVSFSFPPPRLFLLSLIALERERERERENGARTSRSVDESLRLDRGPDRRDGDEERRDLRGLGLHVCGLRRDEDQYGLDVETCSDSHAMRGRGRGRVEKSGVR
jgi:hypothetical protein